MKKIALLVTILIVVSQSVHAQGKKDTGEQKIFLLASIQGGLSSQVGMRNEFTDAFGFIAGGSLKYIYDDPEYPAVAAGVTYFSSVFNDDDVSPGNAKNRIFGQTFDLMVAITRTYSHIAYLSFHGGAGKERFSATSSTGNSTIRTILYGIGIGAFEKPYEKKRLIFGSEMRYLATPELEDISGLFQVIVSVGYAF